jgi:hypothetical protein
VRLRDRFRGRLLAAGKMIVEQRQRLGLALADFLQRIVDHRQPFQLFNLQKLRDHFTT